MRIPFDNLALSVVIAELQEFVEGFVQEIRQPDEHTVTIQVYRRMDGEKGREGAILFSCHPQFARIHLASRRVPNPPQPPVFCSTLRARLMGARLTQVEQVACDRLAVLSFTGDKGDFRLISEMMGTRSNLMLIDESSRLISAAKWMPNLKSGRSIAPNETYRWPPVLNNELLKSSTPQTPQEWFDFAESHPKQISPFFRDLVAKAPPLPKEWTPTYAPEHGAYPLDLRLLNFQAFVRPTLGIALEQHFTRAEQTAGIESAKAQLLGQIDRVIATRELAIADVEEILEQGAAASNWQMVGELILAFGPSAKPGESRLQAMNYQGEFIEIELDPERTFVENSNRYFERAKKAKARQGFMEEKLGRLEQERLDALQFRDLILDAGDISRLDELQSIAKTRRWLSQAAVAQAKGDRPFEGHRIKETFGPGGVRILYGENAESNDYLTLRVAKPNDYWLHVRGSTSAHVVLVTENSPERIQREQLLFAAKIAVSHSGSKHAGFVSVDYTLKKYVRKPRGAAKGAAFYTNEKTLHVES